MTQGKVVARVQTAGKVGETYEERLRVKETLYTGTVIYYTIATLKGGLFSVSCDIS